MVFIAWVRTAVVVTTVLLTGCGGGQPESTPLSESRKTALAADPPPLLETVAGPVGVSVKSLEKVAERRIGRTLFEYDYRIVIENRSVDFVEVTALLQAVGSGSSIKQGVATFAPVVGNAGTTSIGVITISHDRSQPFNLAAFRWSISAKKLPSASLRLKRGTVSLLDPAVEAAARLDLDNWMLTLPGNQALAVGSIVYAAEQLLQIVELRFEGGNTVVKVKPAPVPDLLERKPIQPLGALDLPSATVALRAGDLEALRELLLIFESDSPPVFPATSTNRKRATAVSKVQSDAVQIVPSLAICDVVKTLATTAECVIKLKEYAGVRGFELSIGVSDKLFEFTVGIYPNAERLELESGKVRGVMYTPTSISTNLKFGPNSEKKKGELDSWRERFGKGFSLGEWRVLFVSLGGYVKISPRVEPIFPKIDGFELKASVEPFIDTSTAEIGINNSPAITFNDVNLSSGVLFGQPNPLIEVSGTLGLAISVSADYHLGIYLLDSVEKLLRIAGVKVSASAASPISVGACQNSQVVGGDPDWYFKAIGEISASASVDAYSIVSAERTRKVFPASDEPDRVLAERKFPDACKPPTSLVWKSLNSSVTNRVQGGTTIQLIANVQGHPLFTSPAKPLSDPVKAKVKQGEPPKSTEWVIFAANGVEVCRALVDSSGDAVCSFAVPNAALSMGLSAQYLGNEYYRNSLKVDVAVDIQAQDYRFELIDQSAGALSCSRRYGSQGYSPTNLYGFWADFDHCQRYVTPMMRCVGDGCGASRFFATEYRYTIRSTKAVLYAGSSSAHCGADFSDLVRMERYGGYYFDTYAPGRPGWYALSNSFRPIYVETEFSPHLSGFPVAFKRNFDNIQSEVAEANHNGNLPSQCPVVSHAFEIFIKIFDSLTNQYIYTSYTLNLPAANDPTSALN